MWVSVESFKVRTYRSIVPVGGASLQHNMGGWCWYPKNRWLKSALSSSFKYACCWWFDKPLNALKPAEIGRNIWWMNNVGLKVVVGLDTSILAALADPWWWIVSRQVLFSKTSSLLKKSVLLEIGLLHDFIQECQPSQKWPSLPGLSCAQDFKNVDPSPAWEMGFVEAVRFVKCVVKIRPQPIMWLWSSRSSNWLFMFQHVSPENGRD